MKFFPLIRMSNFEWIHSSSSKKMEVFLLNALAISVNTILFCLGFLAALIFIIGSISGIVVLYIVAKDQYIVLMNLFMPFIRVNETLLSVASNLASISIIGFIAVKTYQFMERKFPRRRR